MMLSPLSVVILNVSFSLFSSCETSLTLTYQPILLIFFMQEPPHINLSTNLAHLLHVRRLFHILEATFLPILKATSSPITFPILCVPNLTFFDAFPSYENQYNSLVLLDYPLHHGCQHFLLLF